MAVVMILGDLDLERSPKTCQKPAFDKQQSLPTTHEERGNGIESSLLRKIPQQSESTGM